MRLFLQSHGLNVCKVVTNGYTVPNVESSTSDPSVRDERALYESNSKAMYVILSGL